MFRMLFVKRWTTIYFIQLGTLDSLMFVIGMYTGYNILHI